MPDSPKVKHNSSNLYLIQRQAYTKLTLREETRISPQQFSSPAYSPHNTITLYCSPVKNLLLFLQYSKDVIKLSVKRVQTLCQFQIWRQKKYNRLTQIQFKLISALDLRALNADFYYTN